MASDCTYCENYNCKTIDCYKREEVNKTFDFLADQFLSGYRKVKELINGKKRVKCHCYKFDSGKLD